jgi:hypothetical protein
MTMYMSVLSCARNRGLVKLAEKVIKRLENIKLFRPEELKTAYVLLGKLLFFNIFITLCLCL